MNDLRDIVARSLAAEGALVEPLEPEGLEIVAPPHVQQFLGIAEWSRVGFAAALPPGASRITLDSDWGDRLERLLGERGRLLSVSLPPDSRSGAPRDLERLLERELALENATYRLTGTAAARTRYLLLTFRLTAVSDDKREDFAELCFNESSGALADSFAGQLWAHLSRDFPVDSAQPGDHELAAPWPGRQVAEWARRALPARVRAQLQPFLEGMQRRMGRDLERLHAYHQNLRAEIGRKARHQSSERRDALRLQAIEREYYAKVEDLERKYAMTVEARFVQALRVAAPVQRSEVVILRRKESRRIHLDWSPLAKSLDVLPCETCWAVPSTRWVRDDTLQLVCADCRGREAASGAS